MRVAGCKEKCEVPVLCPEVQDFVHAVAEKRSKALHAASVPLGDLF